MVTRSELQHLRRELRSTKTLSVYVAGNTDGDEAWKLACRAAMHALDGTRDMVHATTPDERVAFDRALAHAETLLSAHEAVPGRPGLVAFVTAERIHFSRRAASPTRTLVAWGDGPSLSPIVPLIDDTPQAAVAIVDSRSAHLFRRDGRALSACGTLRADAHHAIGAHMGAPPRRGFHPGTRGTTVADTARRLRQAERRRLIGAVAERLKTLAAADDLILLGGIAVVAKATRERVAERREDRTAVLPGVDMHVTIPELTERVTAACDAWQRRHRAAATDEILALVQAGGAAVGGWPATLEALRRRAVSRLLVTDRFLADDFDHAECAVQMAFDSDVDLVRVDGDAAARLDQSAAGVAARLRFPMPPAH